MIQKEKKTAIIAEYATHEGDTGSPEVQIAILTARINELTEHLREKDVLDLRSVQYAILETNGNLSVFPYPECQPASARDAGIRVKPQSLPYTIIEDGYLFRENLRLANKDAAWVEKTLQEHHANLGNTWLLTVDKSGGTIWMGKES